MNSFTAFSWHPVISQVPIDIDDTNRTELVPIKNGNRKKGLVSDNYENSKIFIEIHPANGEEKITSQNKWKYGCFRWSVKKEQNRQRIHLKTPWIIILISVIQIVVHYIGCDNTINALIFTPTKRRDLWRFLSYDFLHSGPAHLYSNVALQLLVAAPLETDQGHLRVLAVYFGGVLFGAIGSALANPIQRIVGASAGVYSLLISHISHSILNWSTLSHRKLRIFAVILMCCSDIAFIRLCNFNENKKCGPKISFAAHGCGALAGFLLGFGVFRRCNECSGRFNYFRWISIILLVCIIAVSTYLLFV